MSIVNNFMDNVKTLSNEEKNELIEIMACILIEETNDNMFSNTSAKVLIVIMPIIVSWFESQLKSCMISHIN